MNRFAAMEDSEAMQREQDGDRGSFYLERDGRRLAELIYATARDGAVAILVHTEVDPSLRGQGVARKLVQAAVKWARANHVRLVPVCPFAKAILAREESFADVLA